MKYYNINILVVIIVITCWVLNGFDIYVALKDQYFHDLSDNLTLVVEWVEVQYDYLFEGLVLGFYCLKKAKCKFNLQ